MSDSPRVALVNMPFSSSKYPSIQLGTLASLLKAQGIGVKTYHLYLGFAYQIGQPLYEVLCEKRGLLGEWLFSNLLSRDNPKNSEYSRTFIPIFESVARETGYSQSYLEELKLQGAPQYLTRMLTEIDWGQYTIVGFTSTFDENVASVTMAKLIKDLCPSITIVFGGANYDGEMGLEHLRAWPWIDYVVVGEGEVPFPALVRQLLDGKEHEEPPAGVAYRKDPAIRFKPSPHLFTEFNKTGPPDYDEYFELLEQLDPQRSQSLNRILLYEGSRGCWWGEKHHCTFCGLNAQAMEFRAKSPDQVSREMAYLSSRYDAIRFRLVDNIIDLKYIDNLFGTFAAERLDLDVFIETKSNLSKRQIQTLAQGGVKCMQPGIESLSAGQLQEMDKGVTPLQNLQCLKWSLYYHIDVSWNILLGFPKETHEDYRKQIALIPSILHLQPPESVGRFWLERFSPYFMRPEKYGLRITGPGSAYEYVYDPNAVDLKKIAYDFEYEITSHVDPGVYEGLVQLVHEWQRRHASADKPFLYYSKSMGYVTIYDGRTKGTPSRQRYDWPEAFMIEYCNEAAKSLEQIRDGLKDQGHAAASDPARLLQALAELVEKRLLYEEKGKDFTIALPMNPNL